MVQLVWLRNDLRIEDNEALFYAAKKGLVCCVYCVTPNQWKAHHESSAKLGLTKGCLINLSIQLAAKNIPLKVLRTSDFHKIPQVLLGLAQSLNAKGLWFNREYPLNEKRRDERVCQLFHQHDIETQLFDGDIIHKPGSVTTRTGSIYHVFTPFAKQWRSLLTAPMLEPYPKPRKQQHSPCDSDDINTVWPTHYDFREELWPADYGTIGKRLFQFTTHKALDYDAQRDLPGIAGTSTLSPYFALGAISIRQAINALREQDPQWLHNQWLTELIWREFYRHLTDQYPHLSMAQNFKPTRKPIPWEDDATLWDAWCQGKTGFPIVDAAMRQLLQTGWMHNRLRMIVAAFLTKLLLIDWRKGEAFFMAHLIDGDYASNNGGWQWAASTGADAAPYFRIFNPQRQSERFDAEGVFIRKLLPELAALDNKSIHNPSSAQRRQTGYPEPIIDYSFARQRALDSYASAMGKSAKAIA